MEELGIEISILDLGGGLAHAPTESPFYHIREHQHIMYVGIIGVGVTLEMGKRNSAPRTDRKL